MILVILRNLCIAGIFRIQGCDLHCDVLAHLTDSFVVHIRLHIDQNDNLAVHMRVAGDKAILLFKLLEAADLQILTDDGDHACIVLCNRLCRICLAGLSKKCINICSLCVKSLVRNSLDIVSELLILSNEVGLGVDLDRNTLLCILRENDHGKTFGSNSSRLLLRRCKSLLAEPLNCCLLVAIRCDERLLAVHHTGTSLFSQFSYQSSCDSHIYPPSV